MKLSRLLVAAVAYGWVASAQAEMCTIDDVPAATLLLPYFEVDLDDRNGADTVFSIHNAGPASTIAHVTMWTDLAIPTLAFDVNLTGYDVEEINLREIFEGRYPAPGTPLAGSVARALAGTTGQPVAELGNDCIGADHGDGAARGYVTIDSVAANGALGRDGGGAGLIGGTRSNVLWGDYRIVERRAGTAVGELLVAVEAGSEPQVEPLPSIWGARYLRGGATTDLIIWRDLSANGITCGPPATLPAGVDRIVVFNEQEDAAEPMQRLPALATSRVRLGTGLDVPFNGGWIFLRFGINQQEGTEAYVTSITTGRGAAFALRGIELPEDPLPAFEVAK